MGIVVESQTFIGIADQAAGSRAEVWLPAGFTLTGGGAYDTQAGRASTSTSTLTACCPIRNEDGQYTGWAAAGDSANGPMAVYAVGIRILKDGVPVRVEQHVFCATSALVSDPGVTVRLGLGWIGTGGGAQDNHASAFNCSMVSANYPLLGADGQIAGWSASARAIDSPLQVSHAAADTEVDTGVDPSAAAASAVPARVTAFVVGIKTIPQVALDLKALAASLRPAFPAGPLAVAETRQPDSPGGRAGDHLNWYAGRMGAAANNMLAAA